MLRLVLDTNVLISATIRSGKPRKLLKAGIEGRFRILSSHGILAEFSEVLQRPKFKMTRDDIISIVSLLVETVENVHVTSARVISRDPDDNMIINMALDGKGDYIVSGDPDLLDLEKFEGIEIMSVSRMLEILERNHTTG